MNTTRRVIPIAERRGDLIFVGLLVSFAFTSFFFDRLAAVHADLEEQTSVFARLLVYYGKTIDPLVLANPLWLRLMSGFSAFVMGPFYLIAAESIYRGRDAIRVPALMWAAIMVYSMFVHMTMEFIGDYPPANLPLLLATYAPYAIAPIALAYRMRKANPFTRPNE